MARQLSATVILDGVSYPKGSAPHREVADRITNQRAWTETPTATEPPRSGPGSGVEAWRTYATSRGIDVPEDATRDDIVTLVEG